MQIFGNRYIIRSIRLIKSIKYFIDLSIKNQIKYLLYYYYKYYFCFMVSEINKIKSIPFFFIIARPRSGTTLLRTLLDAHSNIIIPIESPLILHLSGKYKNIRVWNKKKLTDFYNDLLNVLDFNTWPVDHEKLRKDILECEGKTSFSSICKVVHYNYISSYKKNEIKYLGDKNPRHSNTMPLIFKLFPHAKYIHLVRDYRDHILSMTKTRLANISNIVVIAYRWKYSAKKMDKFKKKYPGSFFTIRYEDLVNNPSCYLKNICDFLEIPYEETMLDSYRNVEEAYKTYTKERIAFYGKLTEPVTNSRSNLWQTEMKEIDIKIADSIAGKYAGNLGYIRKYKKYGILFYLKILPGITVAKFVYFLHNSLGIFPYGIKSRIKIFISLYLKRIFLKIVSLFIKFR